MPGSVRRLLIAVILLAYPAIGLYPFGFTLPRVVSNAADSGPESGLRFTPPGPGIARSHGPPDWIDAAVTGHQVDTRLEVRPSAADQTGPARILTVSKDPSHRNLTVGQDGSDLIVRVRTPWHSLNGSPQYRLPDVFRAQVWSDIRVRIEPGRLLVEVDGEPRLSRQLPNAPLSNWDRSYRLALGNELTGDRTWLGEIRRAAVTVADRETDYAQPGVLEIPPRLWFWNNRPNLIPFQGFSMRDAVINVLGFMPLGAVLGFWTFRSSGRSPWLAGGLVIAASLVLEILQVAIPQRYPSVNDLIANAVGGALGIGLARWLGWPTAISSRNYEVKS